MTFSLGLINFLEWLTELRETLYLVDFQLIIKGCKLSNRQNRSPGQAGYEAAVRSSLTSLNMPLCPDLHMPTNSATLQSPFFWILRRLHCTNTVDWIIGRFDLQPLPPPWCLKVLTLYAHACFPWPPSLGYQSVSKGQLTDMTKDIFITFIT